MSCVWGAGGRCYFLLSFCMTMHVCECERGGVYVGRYDLNRSLLPRWGAVRVGIGLTGLVLTLPYQIK